MAGVFAYTIMMVTAITTVSLFIPPALGQNQCNITLWANESDGYITSPNYPNDYPSNTDCQWTITATVPSDVVFLKVLDFYLETPTSISCKNDSVAIYDGVVGLYSAKLDYDLCGHVATRIYRSTGRSMSIVFRSDSLKNFRGFKLEYSSRDPLVVCGNTNLWANETAKYITSPDYPINYPQKMNCQWHITSTLSSKLVVLKVLDFDVYKGYTCQYDYVAIYDGNNTLSPIIEFFCGQGSNTTETTFTSTGSSMTVVFKSDSDFSRINKGFKFEYTTQDKPAKCSEVILWAGESVRTITSPGYPSNYSDVTDCQWYITASLPSKIVVVKVLDFFMEGLSNSTCTSYDYAALYNGNRSSNSTIAVLCDKDFNQNILYRSTGRSMTFVFHSNLLNNYTGFKIAYFSQERSVRCSDATTTLNANETAKYITSPDYPYNYPRNVHCSWTIESPLPSKVIMLKVLDFDLDKLSEKCLWENVNIFDGFGSLGPRMESLCGEISNTTTFTSTGKYMGVVFNSDSSGVNKGFKLEYTLQDKPAQCRNVTLWASEDARHITSPGYPNTYPNFADCQWYITASLPSRLVVVQVLDFFLEDSDDSSCADLDYVAFYDGNTNNSRLINLSCGQKTGGTIISSGRIMTIIFHSNSIFKKRGFHFEYMSQDKTKIQCANAVLTATSTSEYLTSPDYPSEYPDNTDCQWLIKTTSSSVVVLSIVDFFTMTSPSCASDYVNIYDGPGKSFPILDSLCGIMFNKIYTSSENYITVVFHSDSLENIIAKGFKFEYKSVDKQALCGNTYLTANETVNYIVSPNYPNNYPNNINCEWHIAASLSKAVVLKVKEFNLESTVESCILDSVTIYDGLTIQSSKMEQMCGLVSNRQFTSTGIYMTVVFKSDSSTTEKGFILEYSSGEKPAPCSGVALLAEETSKSVQSPNYPFTYPSNTDCSWIISADSSSRVVSLSFDQFSLQGSGSVCANDYVHIYDGLSTSSHLLKVICGDLPYKDIESKGQYMTVVFHSDDLVNFMGFRFTYLSKKPSNAAVPFGLTMVSKFLFAGGSLLISVWISVALI